MSDEFLNSSIFTVNDPSSFVDPNPQLDGSVENNDDQGKHETVKSTRPLVHFYVTTPVLKTSFQMTR